MTNTTPHEPQGLVAEQVTEAIERGVAVADGYTVTTVIPYAEKAPQVKTYTMPVQDLDEYFHTYARTAEIVVDVRPAEASE